MLGAGAILFGSAHLIAWSFSFPSPAERLLWRTSALLAMFAPALIILIVAKFTPIEDGLSEESRASFFSWWSFVGLLVLIMICFVFGALILDC